jgi:HD-GYP domain-containing protein (c-di-GMP phosphodiesterase class II)/CheY-like chemotaxis protein
MAQALLISDNEVINGIYSVNFEVYLNCPVTVVDDVVQAKRLLELNPHFDLVITLCMMGGVDSATQVREHLKSHELEAHLIVIGKQSEVVESESLQILPASYNIRSLMRAAAKILNVTAKEMASLPVPNYYPVSTKLFFHIKTVPCDVFYKVRKGGESEFLLILAKDSKVWPRIRKYLDEGAVSLYVPAQNRLEFANLASEQIADVLQREELTSEQRLDVLEQGIEAVATEYLDSKKASESVVKLSNVCVKTMTDVVEEVPKLKKLIQSLMTNKSGYLYSHAIMATFVANHIVRKISWGGESHIEKLNFVMFFHDIFLVPIYNKYPEARFEEDLLFSSGLTETEKEIVLTHAQRASDIVKTFPRCPMGADQLILQHHGSTNGSGFAVKYKDDISPLAKVIIISEHFVEEIFRFGDDPERSFNKQAVISELKHRYGKSSYTKILETLDSIDI